MQLVEADGKKSVKIYCVPAAVDLNPKVFVELSIKYILVFAEDAVQVQLVIVVEVVAVDNMVEIY